VDVVLHAANGLDKNFEIVADWCATRPIEVASSGSQ
jgi:hypothetical protein